jgi:hypothetical protein
MDMRQDGVAEDLGELTGDYDWAAASPPPGGFRPLRDVHTAFLPRAA